MLPDVTLFESKHCDGSYWRNWTFKVAFIAGPMAKPLIVMENADNPMFAPKMVIFTDEAEVALQAAVRPITLLAPDATLGMTDGAKKWKGYTRVRMLPDKIGNIEKKPKVTETGDLPDILSEDLMSKVDKFKVLWHRLAFQRSETDCKSNTTGEATNEDTEALPICSKKIR
jgi:hypothetical protein